MRASESLRPVVDTFTTVWHSFRGNASGAFN